MVICVEIAYCEVNQMALNDPIYKAFRNKLIPSVFTGELSIADRRNSRAQMFEHNIDVLKNTPKNFKKLYDDLSNDKSFNQTGLIYGLAPLCIIFKKLNIFGNTFIFYPMAEFLIFAGGAYLSYAAAKFIEKKGQTLMDKGHNILGGSLKNTGLILSLPVEIPKQFPMLLGAAFLASIDIIPALYDIGLATTSLLIDTIFDSAAKLNPLKNRL